MQPPESEHSNEHAANEIRQRRRSRWLTAIDLWGAWVIGAQMPRVVQNIIGDAGSSYNEAAAASAAVASVTVIVAVVLWGLSRWITSKVSASNVSKVARIAIYLVLPVGYFALAVALVGLAS